MCCLTLIHSFANFRQGRDKRHIETVEYFLTNQIQDLSYCITLQTIVPLLQLLQCTRTNSALDCSISCSIRLGSASSGIPHKHWTGRRRSLLQLHKLQIPFNDYVSTTRRLTSYSILYEEIRQILF